MHLNTPPYNIRELKRNIPLYVLYFPGLQSVQTEPPAKIGRKIEGGVVVIDSRNQAIVNAPNSQSYSPLIAGFCTDWMHESAC